MDSDESRRERGGRPAYTTGTYEATVTGASETGKYVTAWKKQPEWWMEGDQDIFNADAAPKAPAAASLVAPLL